MTASGDGSVCDRKNCLFVGRLVKVKYYDHVEFRNVSSDKISPILREAVGWIVYDGGNFLVLVFDRPSEDGAAKKTASGLCILKRDILELEEVEDDDRNG